MSSPAPPSLPSAAMCVLLVDDEPLARARLRTLLADIRTPPLTLVGEAASAAEALTRMNRQPADLVLLDIHMPGTSGMELAHTLQRQHPHSQVIFITAHSEYAVEAFDVAATDYLTKPVRRDRLQAAIDKAHARWRSHTGTEHTAAPATATTAPATAATQPAADLVIRQRGRIQRIPVHDILYARAELKYVTLYLAHAHEAIWDGSLNELEEQHPHAFLRIHRNTLVYRNAVQQCKKILQPDGSEGWFLQLHGLPTWLPISRRMLSAVRAAVTHTAP